MAIFFLSKLCQKSAEKKWPKKYFFYFYFKFWWWFGARTRALCLIIHEWRLRATDLFKSVERKYFFFFFQISFWCLSWDLNRGLIFNRPPHYLLDYDKFMWIISIIFVSKNLFKFIMKFYSKKKKKKISNIFLGEFFRPNSNLLIITENVNNHTKFNLFIKISFPWF